MIDAQSYIAADTLKDGTPVTIRAIGKDDRVDLWSPTLKEISCAH